MSSEQSVFHGIIPPLITPLTKTNEFDPDGMTRLLQHIIKGKVDGVLLLGSTGESPSLSLENKKQAIKHTVKTVADRLPVVVAAIDCCEDHQDQIISYASECGADAALCSGPFYYPISPTVLAKSLETAADSSPIPIMLYNFPTLTGNTLLPEIVSDLFDHPNIIGIKDSSGDLTYLEQLIRINKNREDITILVGPDQLLYPALLAGADGGMPSGANILPKIYVNLYNAVVGSHNQIARDHHYQLVELVTTLFGSTPDINTAIQNLKVAAKLLGLCKAHTASPLNYMTPVSKTRITQLLIDQGLIEPAD